MPLPSLSESLGRSKARLKRWLNIDIKPTTQNIAPVVRDMCPSVRSLITQIQSSAEVFGPLKSAISELARVFEAYDAVSEGQSEYKEVRTSIDRVLNDICDYVQSPTRQVMTDSMKLICVDIKAEIAAMEKKQELPTGRLVLNAIQGLDAVTDCCRRVQGHLERLKINLNLSILNGIDKQIMEQKLTRMSPSMAATYDSAESVEIKRGACTPGTRKPQIDLLLEWAQTSDSGKTCWMNGMAGTGKTTIAYTVCSELKNTSQLAASFFCSRTIPECRQVKHIIPSIAYQLARFSLPFWCALANILEEDPDAHTRALNVQYQKLIIEPLTKAQDSLPTDFIVVIDALDECDNRDTVAQILDVLLSGTGSLPIRYLMSSRPEKEIADRLAGRLAGQDEARLVLHNLNPVDVRSDIEAYMRAELTDISLTDGQWQGIIDRCGSLFIYASTTCRYIKQAHEMETLETALSVIMSSSSIPMDEGDDNPIDHLYMTILRMAFKPGANQGSKKKIKDILDTVICAMEPMTLSILASVVGLKSGTQVDKLLMPLRSVVNVAKETGLVTTLHASFPDFMLSPNRSGDFYCQPQRRHATMAESCLGLIDGAPSSFNICALPSSYLLDSEVKDFDMRVSKSIPGDLIYACRHWSAHLDHSEYRIELAKLVGRFFSSRLLLWMEIINLTKHMRHGTSIIQTAEKWCSEKNAPEELTRLSHDASQFVSVYANHPVSQSTPHIYVSMLPFWPRSRPVSASYTPRASGLVRPAGTAIDRRQLALIATWKVSAEGIESFGLSADGTRLAAPTENSIDVYSTTTGESVLSLTDERTRGVSRVEMSPDSTRVAFVGTDRIAYLWDIANEGKVSQLLPDGTSDVFSIAFSPDWSHVACGTRNGDIYMRELQQQVSSTVLLRGHTHFVLSVAFSPDSSHLASGSADRAVRVWKVRTGQPAGEAFEGHTRWVRSVSYSHEGSRLALASEDGTIQVWNPQTGQTVLGPLTGHSGAILSVTFSPNGTLIASASSDKTIRVYDADTSQTVLGPLQGHTGGVKCVRFSSDSTRLYSCSNDGTVRVWNMQDLGSSIPPSSGPLALKPINSIRYSPSGARAVSGSSDGSVHVWDVRTGALVLGPLPGHDQSVESVDYSPSDQYIISGSGDGTLRIWDASTGKDIHGPMDAHSDWVRCVRFSPDSSVVVSGSDDRTVQIWDVATGQHVMQLLEGNNWILSVGFSPDGHKVVCGSEEKIHVMDRYTGNAVVEPITGHSDWINSTEFSPDGKRLVSGADDQTVRIWDAQTGKQLVVCGDNQASHRNYVSSVGFSPNGLFVVSGSQDRTVCVWDGQNGKRILGPLKGHTNYVKCVEFSPDGSHIVSCSDDATIRFWDATSCTRAIKANTATGAATKVSHTPSPNSDSTHDSWLVDDDGWAVDSHNQRLVWVPSDLRESLLFPPNSLTTATNRYYVLGFVGANVGEKWADCYGP